DPPGTGDHLVTLYPNGPVCGFGPVRCRRPNGEVLGQLAPFQLPFLPAAIHKAHVAVPVDLEVPVGVRGEPVVVPAVEDYRVVLGDATPAEQGFERLLIHEIPPHAVLELVFPVEGDRARNMATRIRVGILVNLDQVQRRIAQPLRDPGRADQDLAASIVVAHLNPPVGMGQGKSKVRGPQAATRDGPPAGAGRAYLQEQRVQGRPVEGITGIMPPPTSDSQLHGSTKSTNSIWMGHPMWWAYRWL